MEEKVGKWLPKYVGLRTIKTALAVILSALFTVFVLKDIPFFACIGAVVAMEKTIEESRRAAFIRNLGTLGGGIIGMIFSQISSNSIFLGLGVIPIIVLKNILNKQETIVPACIVYFAVVYLNTSETATSYGLRRIIETFIGTLIAIAINYLIFRPEKSKAEKKEGEEIDTAST